MAFFVAFTLMLLVGVTAYLLITLVRNIQSERRSSNVRNLSGNFGLVRVPSAVLLRPLVRSSYPPRQRRIEGQRRPHGTEDRRVDQAAP
jgi:hypothetical protein